MEEEELLTLENSQMTTKVQLTNCNQHHPPIWYYDDDLCPLCNAYEEIEEKNSELLEMIEKAYDSDIELERLQSKVSELEDERKG